MCERINIKMKYTLEEYNKIVKSLNENIICLDGIYENSHSDMKYRCDICGFEFKKTANNFKRNSNCPKCSGKYRYTYEDVKQSIESEGYKLHTSAKSPLL